MKILIQLEVEYEDGIKKENYIQLIKIIKNHYENHMNIIETRNAKFKSLGVVKISRVIQ